MCSLSILRKLCSGVEICEANPFFLFKQKTAYEMRISDWSSDVCSSDLGFQIEYTVPFLDVESRDRDQRVSFRLPFDPRQIGRASCRERVCPYGVDLGGRRIIQKKVRLRRHSI